MKGYLTHGPHHIKLEKKRKKKAETADEDAAGRKTGCHEPHRGNICDQRQDKTHRDADSTNSIIFGLMFFLSLSL